MCLNGDFSLEILFIYTWILNFIFCLCGWGCWVCLLWEAELEFQSRPSFLRIRHSGIGCDALATPTVNGLPGLFPRPSRVRKNLKTVDITH